MKPCDRVVSSAGVPETTKQDENFPAAVKKRQPNLYKLQEERRAGQREALDRAAGQYVKAKHHSHVFHPAENGFEFSNSGNRALSRRCPPGPDRSLDPSTVCACTVGCGPYPKTPVLKLPERKGQLRFA